MKWYLADIPTARQDAVLRLAIKNVDEDAVVLTSVELPSVGHLEVHNVTTLKEQNIEWVIFPFNAAVLVQVVRHGLNCLVICDDREAIDEVCNIATPKDLGHVKIATTLPEFTINEISNDLSFLIKDERFY